MILFFSNMKIGITLVSVMVLTGALLYMIGSKWQRFPKDVCWAEVAIESATPETKGEFVLVFRHGKVVI